MTVKAGFTVHIFCLKGPNNVIADTKSQYAVLTYDRNNLDNIPDSEIQFTINDQLFLETLLMEIRAKTISYSIFKTRQNKDNEKDLLNDIRKLESRYRENVDLINYYTKRAELESIREQKLKGSRIRSRIKWVEQGEKPTKYFCNLENRKGHKQNHSKGNKRKKWRNNWTKWNFARSWKILQNTFQSNWWRIISV